VIAKRVKSGSAIRAFRKGELLEFDEHVTAERTASN
jgi:hypothetical protein